MATYEGYGLSFRYPEDWELTESRGEDGGHTVHVQSDGTAFWSLNLSEGVLQPDEVFEAVAGGLEGFYDDIERHHVEDPVCIGGTVGVASTLECVCHELPVIAEAVVFHYPHEGTDYTALVLAQYADVESDEFEILLERMTASIALRTLEAEASR